jgi:hypothetical protein
MGTNPHFINVDLRVKSRRGLDAFIAEMKRKAFHQAEWKRGGVHFVCFEVHRAGLSCEGTIKAFCRMLEKLSSAAIREWRASYSKVFDAGFESGDENPRCALELSPETLERVAKLKASLAITLYPLDPASEPRK